MSSLMKAMALAAYPASAVQLLSISGFAWWTKVRSTSPTATVSVMKSGRPPMQNQSRPPPCKCFASWGALRSIHRFFKVFTPVAATT